MAHELRREVVHTDEFLADMKGLLGTDERIEDFLRGFDILIQVDPAKMGVRGTDPSIYWTFALGPGGENIGIYYQFDPDDAPSNRRKVYCIAAH